MYPGIPTYRYDVAIVGAGTDALHLANQCVNAGLATGLVGIKSPLPDLGKAVYHAGTGFLTSDLQIAVLDPRTGDETAFLAARAIAMSYDEKHISTGDTNTFFNGLRKLGVHFTADQQFVSTDTHGRTSRAGIFAIGSCSQDSTGRPPDAAVVAMSIITYCKELHE
jgi:thioredoxin reductase